MTPAPSHLSERLRGLVEGGPMMGAVVMQHIQRGESFRFDADTLYPTASVFKIPVLVEAVRRVSSGEVSLAERWELTEAIKSAGSGVLVRLMSGLRPTVRDLLTLMIIISDNTATDMLVERLGAARITMTMRELGLHNTVVKTGCRGLLASLLGDADPSLPPHEMARHVSANPAPDDAESFAQDGRTNVSTAAEMVQLLVAIDTGEGMDRIGIDAAARTTMRDILLLQQLNDRLPRFLPPGAAFAHKTGSLSGAWAIRNDAGLLDLGERGTVAIAVFSRTRMPNGGDPRDRNRLLTAIDEQIGEIARAVYDHYAG